MPGGTPSRSEPAVGRRTYVSLLAVASLSGCLGDGDEEGDPTSTPSKTTESTSSAEWPMYRRSFDGNPILETAVSAQHGFRLRWRHEVSAYSWRQSQPPTPVLSDGIVVFPGTDRVVAYDAESGDELWSIGESAKRPQPCVRDGVVYVPVEASDDESTSLRAIDLASGEEQWTVDHGDPRWPIVHGGTLYVPGASDGPPSVVAIDASSGDQEWTAGGDTAVSPVAGTDETLFVGTDSGLRAFDAATGEGAWDEVPDAPVTTPPTVADGSV